MKRIIIIAVALLFGISGFCQEHMKFKGIPIDGTPKELARKLVEQGYKYLGEYDDGRIGLEGVFAGYQGTIAIEPNVRGIAQQVMVVYDVSIYPWKSLKARWMELEQNLISKYGNPVIATKIMDDLLYYDGSGYEMDGFRQGKNDYTYSWYTEEGVIGLMIMATTDGSVFLTIWYQDTANSQVSDQAAYDDL